VGKRKRGVEVRIECVNGKIPDGAVEAALAVGPVDCLHFDCVSHDAVNFDAELAQIEANTALIEAETISRTQRLEEVIAWAEAEIALNELAIAENELMIAQLEEARAIAEIRRQNRDYYIAVAAVTAACSN